MDQNTIDAKLNREFKDFIKSKIESLIAELEDLKVIYNRVESGLNPTPFEYKVPQDAPLFVAESTESESKSTFGWKYKIREALTELGRPATTSEIIRFIVGKYPEIDPKVAQKSVSSTMSTNSKDPKHIFKKKISNGIHYFELNQ
jgi:hypothetical protein